VSFGFLLYLYYGKAVVASFFFYYYYFLNFLHAKGRRRRLLPYTSIPFVEDAAQPDMDFTISLPNSQRQK